MTTDEYVEARAQLGMSVDEWIKKLGISKDTHKSYNSGRLDIQEPVANHIITLKELDQVQKSVLSTLK